MTERPLGYLGGDIMTHGSNLARQEEYDKFKEAGIPGSVYSPIQNKSINDKSSMTEEENNHLAEKICEADIERLWNSDYTVLCPEQSAIGTMCEMGVLYGWKYMADKLLELIANEYEIESSNGQESNETKYKRIADKFNNLLQKIYSEIQRIANKQNYAHYFDIRTNHLNEKDWRRSFSINQMLYGMILYATADNTLHNSFDEIIPLLKQQYCNEPDPETVSTPTTLQSWDTFIQADDETTNVSIPQYVMTNIACPKCGKPIRKDVSQIFTSWPPSNRYSCECGWVGFAHK